MQFSYQTAASAATPLPLFRTGWTISLKNVYCLAALLDGSAFRVQLLVCVQFWTTDFLQSRFLASQYSPRASRSRLSLSTVSDLLSPLSSLALPSPALYFVRF